MNIPKATPCAMTSTESAWESGTGKWTINLVKEQKERTVSPEKFWSVSLGNLGKRILGTPMTRSISRMEGNCVTRSVRELQLTAPPTKQSKQVLWTLQQTDHLEHCRKRICRESLEHSRKCAGISVEKKINYFSKYFFSFFLSQFQRTLIYHRGTVKASRDFYHNRTKSILQQLQRKFWKIEDVLFRISWKTNSFK